jgi:predicted metal-dependent HD superfamily phosphohydrolase
LLAEERLRLSPLPERQVENVAYYILATATHKYNLGGDSLLLIDADLSIFGASEEVYHQYAQNIRKEYRLYPGFMYKRGRRKALQGFLERKTIYHTAHFQEKYEEQARNNLERELQTLS